MGLFKKKKKNELLEVEVSDKNIGMRIAGAIILFLIGIGFLAYFLISLITVDEGWTTIEVSSGNGGINDEIIFNYNLGQGEESATKEWKKLTDIYTEAANHADQLFDVNSAYDGVTNLYKINRSVGKEITVNKVLYKAFELTEKYSDRSIYLGPIYAQYNNIFFSESDAEAAVSDPYLNKEAEAYAQNVAMYASDSNHVKLELLGNNRIKLVVSDEYKQFIAENGIENVVDFAYLRNAFVVDHIADTLAASGYTRGNISSSDGYVRNLDASKDEYAINIFDRVGKNVFTCATMCYGGPAAIVTMRDFPMNTKDSYDYYTYADDRIAHRFVSAESGKYTNSISSIVSYSHSKSCAEIALQLSKVFIDESLDESKIEAMFDSEIYTVWTVNAKVRYNDAKVKVDGLFAGEERQYTSEIVKYQ